MRAANIIAGIAVILWLALFLMGRDLAYGIYSHGAGVYPSAGQIDFLMVFPASIVVALLLLAWACNLFRRLSGLLILASAASIVALFPYLFVYGGGV